MIAFGIILLAAVVWWKLSVINDTLCSICCILRKAREDNLPATHGELRIKKDE